MKKNISQEERFEKIQKSKWAKACDMLFGLIVLNANIIIFSILGLGVFGIGPAIYAGFEILNENQGVNLGTSIFKDFWRCYKKNFVKGNILFYSILVILLVFLKNIFYYTAGNSMFTIIGSYVIGALFILFIATICSYYTVDVKYKEKTFKDRLRISFYLIFIKPSIILTIILLSVLFGILMLLFPQFIIFFGIATPIYIMFKPVNKYINSLIMQDEE